MDGERQRLAMSVHSGRLRLNPRQLELAVHGVLKRPAWLRRASVAGMAVFGFG